MGQFRTEVVPNAAYTVSGSSQPVQVNTASMLAVMLNITALSGTPAFDCWLEASDDGGTTWYEVPADQVLKHAGVAAENTVVINHRSVVDNHTSGTAKYLARYGFCPYDRVRLTWTISGGTPVVTFDAVICGK